jgi:conjugal transfer/entry exclusion protein
MRARHTVPAVLAALLFLAGCGHGGNAQSAQSTQGTGTAQGTQATRQPAPTSSADLGHLRKLVDDADSAASEAESDMARE